MLYLDVAFKVGGDSGVNYIVLQVHYKKVDHFLGELIISFNRAFAYSCHLLTLPCIKKWSQESGYLEIKKKADEI